MNAQGSRTDGQVTCMRQNPKRSFACFVLVLFMCPVPYAQPGQEKPRASLSLEAQLVNRRIRLGEPVYVDLQLTNIGGDQIVINRRFHLNETISISVVGPQGKQEEWCGVLPEWADLPNDFVILASGAHISGRVRVNCDERQKVTWGYKLPSPGEYVLTARYELLYPISALKEAAGSAVVIKGPVKANSVHLTVLPRE